MTIYTMVKAWRQISRELAEREQCQTSLPNTYDNMDCIENEAALNASVVTKDSEDAQAAADRRRTVDSCADSEHSANNEVTVHVETYDTSF